MIRDILVSLQFNQSDAAALDAAAALAAAHDAQVIVLATVACPVPMATEWGLAAMPLSQADFERIRDDVARDGEAARQRVEQAGAACELRVVETLASWPEDVAALHGRHADLCVIGGPVDDARGSRFPLQFSALLMHSGRPVLLVPQRTCLLVPPRRVVLAWQPRREASRAIHDALALLPRDARVDVLCVDPQVGELQHGQQPGADIGRHLARHGLQVTVELEESRGRSVGAVIIDHAATKRADLVVMGGYGHARWREQLLGGATRSVLEQATMPVLFGH
jgi:nucleotide-binding universal stress UspA family protein